MPLVLDFHHEIKRQGVLRRRDPVKFAVGGIAAIVLGFSGNYVYQFDVAHRLASELSSAQMDYKKLQAKADLAKKREDELSSFIKTSELLVKRVEGRFYWAPVLGFLAEIVPREVQITRLSGDTSTETLKHCTITIEGTVASAEPRKIAEELRKAIADHFSAKYKSVVSSFKSLEEGIEMVKRDGKLAHTASFSINVQLRMDQEPLPTTYKGRKSP
jgi:hypothetical protein